MAKELLKREDVAIENTWKVEDMYATVQDWEKDLEEIAALVDQVAALEGKLSESAANLLKCLELDAAGGQKLELAYNYAQRLFDQDQKNTKHQAMTAKVMNIYAEASGKTAFVQPEVIDLSDETMEAFYKAEPGLELYRIEIDEIRRRKAHCLSAEMEKLIAQTMEMSQVPEDAFSIMNDADFVFPEMQDEKGETVRITHGRYGNLMESPDRRVRKEAFEKMYSVYKQFNNTLAALYNGQVKTLIFHAKAKKYASTLEASVDRNNVSPQVYKNLVETINANLELLHRYVRLRKKCLGVDELHMYDIYVPMIEGVAKVVPYEEAKATVLKALEPLGEDYLAKLREGFANRWIDVYENEGKRSGAYSAGAYGTHPYVLLNHNDTLDSMFTLAHEMGHALHSCYSNENQPYIYADYKIFVAEVASTTNEILLLEYLLKNTTDKKERAYLLNHYLDSFKGTVFRQTQFAEFEMKSNELCESGESLNAENLNAMYYELNQRYYGPDMISDEQIAYEWARIPHFYYDFYVYQYATSFSASVAIARAILSEGAPAVERYKKFLSGGCSKPPVELLKIAGVNMETAAPIESAMKAFEEILGELENLVG
ncbi:MAG: oligoendopeptidase F [Lachnospiraceae bacterium]|nr:oligoendopeptidase F [Lachnospiraceae bacterium]MBP5265114.1 oligoendopeptidase F [Lachnospiraceae bacterium]